MDDEERWCRVIRTRETTLREAKIEAGFKVGGHLVRPGMTAKQRAEAERESDRRDRETIIEGGTFFMCGRGRAPSICGCGYESTHLCDFPMGGEKTCDRPLCDDCRTRIGHDLDLCRVHATMWRDAPRLSSIPRGGK